jgi:acyl-coenzyme A thioesterase PaaI-like protein
MEIRTHQTLDRRWSGRPVEIAPGEARLELETTPEMTADAAGLVHGGFVFSLADHAAMLAVNEPTVVLGRAEARFLAPVAVGERLDARARVVERRQAPGRAPKATVEVTVRSSEREVFTGTFSCAVPAEHVLSGMAAVGGER